MSSNIVEAAVDSIGEMGGSDIATSAVAHGASEGVRDDGQVIPASKANIVTDTNVSYIEGIQKMSSIFLNITKLILGMVALWSENDPIFRGLAASNENNDTGTKLSKILLPLGLSFATVKHEIELIILKVNRHRRLIEIDRTGLGGEISGQTNGSGSNQIDQMSVKDNRVEGKRSDVGISRSRRVFPAGCFLWTFCRQNQIPEVRYIPKDEAEISPAEEMLTAPIQESQLLEGNQSIDGIRNAGYADEDIDAGLAAEKNSDQGIKSAADNLNKTETKAQVSTNEEKRLIRIKELAKVLEKLTGKTGVALKAIKFLINGTGGKTDDKLSLDGIRKWMDGFSEQIKPDLTKEDETTLMNAVTLTLKCAEVALNQATDFEHTIVQNYETLVVLCSED